MEWVIATYLTEDLAANRRFYGEFLRLPLQSDHEEVYFLVVNGETCLQVQRAQPDIGPTTRSAHILLWTANKDEPSALAARAAEMGFEVVNAGSESVLFRDPDGRLVTVSHHEKGNPFRP